MTAGDYNRWSAPFRTPGRAGAVRAVNRTLTLLCFLCYPLSLLWLLARADARLWGCIALPGSGFLLVSLFRRRFNAPRPYEALDIVPLMEKGKHGQSFPSRHVFSIFIIAMTLLRLSVPLGVVFLTFGVVLAWCRVILGVHFPRDVIAGGIAGILWGLPGFFLPL